MALNKKVMKQTPIRIQFYLLGGIPSTAYSMYRARLQPLWLTIIQKLKNKQFHNPILQSTKRMDVVDFDVGVDAGTDVR